MEPTWWNTKAFRMSIGTVLVVVATALRSMRNNPPPPAPPTNVTETAPRQDTNAALRSARAEAQRRWPEFLTEFDSRQPGHVFLARFKFTQDTQSEYLWLQVAQITGQSLTGKLLDTPEKLKNLTPGQQLTRATTEVDDWIIRTPAGTTGDFIDSALRAATETPTKNN